MDHDPKPPALPLDSAQRAAVDRIVAALDPDRLRQIVVEMVDVPSPTGEERALAEHLVARARRHGLAATVQALDDSQANALLRYDGAGDGADLLLYAPIDTHTSGREAEDLPWSGAELRSDMVPKATVYGDFVTGLGANNPKGHAAAIVGVAEAVAAAGVELRGNLLVGLGAGGMPTNRRPVQGVRREDVGHGRGAAFMLERGFRGDFAVIAKTGWQVSWEEVGLSWYRIRVHGAMNYTGVRHFVAYDNPIVQVGRVVDELEAWFPEYTAANTSGLVAPQASIGAIEGGWTHKPTFPPAACDLYLDVRLSPRTAPGAALAALRATVRRIAEKHDLRLTVEPLLAVPGSHTDPGNWIIGSAMRAWADIEGRPHQARGNQSGATDANVLRGAGLPVARIGMARVPDDAPMPDDFSKGMNVVDIRDVQKLARHLAYVIVDSCTRTRAEVGL